MLSVVTPTLHRPQEVRELLANLAQQTLPPSEVIIVDGAPTEERATERAVAETAGPLPFTCRYVRSDRGTAVQRNFGIDRAQGRFVALIDDDVRLAPDFFARMIDVFDKDQTREIGGLVGYRTNTHGGVADSERWRWYRRLHFFSTYEPGRYDYLSGYPINNNLQPPFTGTRDVDFMTTACAVWRREVFDSGLRFDLFFRDYGVLEDAHFSLRARQQWKLLQCGDAHCIELHAAGGRVDRRKIGYKCVVNYYYVFRDIAQPLTLMQRYRFWRFQIFEFFRIAASAVRRRRQADLLELRGRLEGVMAVARGEAKSHQH
jgi:glycosyltransferase involved in cell wall biosynthesis